jgi:hypothetical protein
MNGWWWRGKGSVDAKNQDAKKTIVLVLRRGTNVG